MIQVQLISKDQTYPIRNKVLRKGKPIETCFFDGDDLKTTFHFGIIIDKEIIGVASVYNVLHYNFSEENQCQLRGMAILEKYQNSGMGNRLLSTVESFCIQTKTNILWFNAREKALPFYKKLNYQVAGNAFEIENIGTHYLMFKKLL